jgi:hypothetical protein
MTVIKGLYIFFNIISDCKYIKVFKLLMHLGIRAYIIILFKALHARNLLLLKVLSCFIGAAIYKISIKFLFKSSRNFKGGKVGINN